MNKTTEFEPSRYLDKQEIVVEYIDLALSSGDVGLVLSAIGDVVKAKGIVSVARNTGLSLEYLSHAFEAGASPSFEAVHKVLNAIGIQLQVHCGARKTQF